MTLSANTQVADCITLSISGVDEGTLFGLKQNGLLWSMSSSDYSVTNNGFEQIVDSMVRMGTDGTYTIDIPYSTTVSTLKFYFFIHQEMLNFDQHELIIPYGTYTVTAYVGMEELTCTFTYERTEIILPPASCSSVEEYDPEFYTINTGLLPAFDTFQPDDWNTRTHFDLHICSIMGDIVPGLSRIIMPSSPTMESIQIKKTALKEGYKYILDVRATDITPAKVTDLAVIQRDGIPEGYIEASTEPFDGQFTGSQGFLHVKDLVVEDKGTSIDVTYTFHTLGPNVSSVYLDLLADNKRIKRVELSSKFLTKSGMQYGTYTFTGLDETKNYELTYSITTEDFTNYEQTKEITRASSDINKPVDITVSSDKTNPNIYSGFDIEFNTESGDYGTYKVTIEGTNNDGTKFTKEVAVNITGSPSELYLPDIFTDSELSNIKSFNVSLQSVLDDSSLGDKVTSNTVTLSTLVCTINSITVKNVDKKLVLTYDVTTDYLELDYKVTCTATNKSKIEFTGTYPYTTEIVLDDLLVNVTYTINYELLHNGTSLASKQTTGLIKISYDTQLTLTSSLPKIYPNSDLTVTWLPIDLTGYDNCSLTSYSIINHLTNSSEISANSNKSTTYTFTNDSSMRSGQTRELRLKANVTSKNSKNDTNNFSCPDNYIVKTFTVVPFDKPSVSCIINNVTNDTITIKAFASSTSLNNHSQLKYNYQIYKGNTKVAESLNQTSDTHTFTNLDPATEYTLKVASVIGLKSNTSEDVVSNYVSTKASTIDPNVKEYRLRIIK